MKEQLTAELLKLLQNVNNGTEGAVNLLKEKVPVICNQIVSWEIGFGSFMVILFGIFLFASIWLMNKRKEANRRAMLCGDCDVGFGIGLIVLVISMIVMIVNTSHIIKASIAPDIVVLETLKTLL